MGGILSRFLEAHSGDGDNHDNGELFHQRNFYGTLIQTKLCRIPQKCRISAKELISKSCEMLQLSDENLHEVMRLLRENIERGLHRDTHPNAAVKCYVTYVQDVPSNTEKGTYLAVEMRGTTFKILSVKLIDEHTFDMEAKDYGVPAYVKKGVGKILFKFIYDCLFDFMTEHNLIEEHLPLSFTFCFPMKQRGLAEGYLIKWTKGFTCTGVVGKDVTQLLKEAISHGGNISVDVVAVLNDTTGTLMSCAWRKHDCKIGVTLDAGTNACYFEKVENAEMFEDVSSKPHVLINTEWGAFGDDRCLDFIRTEFDEDIDKNSINEGRQLFDKMCAGVYVGEMVRLVIVKLVISNLLFGGRGSEELFQPGSFLCHYVAEIERDEIGTYKYCRQVFDLLNLQHATDEDCDNVRYVCQIVTTRAAHLASAGLATLINKIADEHVTVGVDGSIYRFHPHFHHLMQDKLATLVEPKFKYKLDLSEAGSAFGAALLAAVTCQDNLSKTSLSK